MAQLDAWTEATVVMPLADPKSENNFDATVEEVKKAIRQKVLESYRNGQAVGASVKSQPGKFQPRRQTSK